MITRQRHRIRGTVQGVGFRPFIFRTACRLGLTGFVRNTSEGVEIEVQGELDSLNVFETCLENELPPLAVVTAHDILDIEPCVEKDFIIAASTSGIRDVQVAPDSAICCDCLKELHDPENRRYRYPFITCTNCGPRFSIITAVPYDRPNTTMSHFPLCPECLAEYNNPLDRRFHAQPIGCHKCGPTLSLSNANSEVLQTGDAAVRHAVRQLKDGAVIAVKGIGGYHLAVDATNYDAVQLLRKRKNRDEKPFAVMVGSTETAYRLAMMTPLEERLLTSVEAPIVICRNRVGSGISPLVAPGSGWLGLMLPYSPLHQLLFTTEYESSHGKLLALVMTSGNISSEPVVYHDDAIVRLAGIADFFLINNRPIHIRNDDSVVRSFQNKPLFYRRSRGYAPRTVALPFAVKPLLATGAELKNSICLAQGESAVLSQHIGDLQNSATFDSFKHTVRHLADLFSIKAEAIACDLHPDYLSTRYAEDSGLPLIKVQHHHAHMASCMAENRLAGDVIGIILDGTGYGTDGTIWGGEFFIGSYTGFTRAGHFKCVPMPGGDSAVHEPWRMAVSYLYQALGDGAFTLPCPADNRLDENEYKLFRQMVKRGINSPLSSSCGRLFDAVAATIGIRSHVSYDGQAAIELEALAETAQSGSLPIYPYTIDNTEKPFQIDFAGTISAIVNSLQQGADSAEIAASFHATVANAVTAGCMQCRNSSGITDVVLSGGVFQNRLLSEMVYNALTVRGMNVHCHRLVPPNDGGLALGQAAVAGAKGA